MYKYLLCFFLVSGLALPLATAQEKARVVSGPGYEGVLFTGAEAGFLVNVLVRSQNTSFGPMPAPVEPTLDELKRAEAALVPALRAHADKRLSELAPKISGYKRQYAGAVEGEHRLVVINFVCDVASHPRWAQAVVMVKDGGACYAQAVYDLNTGRFRLLQVNGEA